MVCRATPPSLCFGGGDEEDGPAYSRSMSRMVLLGVDFVIDCSGECVPPVATSPQATQALRVPQKYSRYGILFEFHQRLPSLPHSYYLDHGPDIENTGVGHLKEGNESHLKFGNRAGAPHRQVSRPTKLESRPSSQWLIPSYDQLHTRPFLPFGYISRRWAASRQVDVHPTSIVCGV